MAAISERLIMMMDVDQIIHPEAHPVLGEGPLPDGVFGDAPDAFAALPASGAPG